MSGVSGEMKFGILVGGLKPTYHALQPWLDLQIWKSKDFLMYNFSNADQSTAAGHEDPHPTSTSTPSPHPSSISVFHILTRLAFRFHITTLAVVDLDNSSLFPSQGSLQLSRAPVQRSLRLHHPLFGFPIMLNPHMSPNPLFAPPLAPAWVINYLMESIWC